MSAGGSQWKVNGETHYERNRAAYIQKAAERKRNIRTYMQQLKEQLGCVDCGIKDHRVLDFDHVGTKTINPSAMAEYGWGREKIKKELAQCEVRCSNCHRIKTWKRNHADVA